MLLWRNNTVKTTQSISFFLLSSKPSRKHLDKVVLISYIRAEQQVFVLYAHKKSIGAVGISAARGVWWIHCSEQCQGTAGHQGQMSTLPPTLAAPGASTLHLWASAKGWGKEEPLHEEKHRAYVGLLLCLWDKNSNSLPLYIQVKITEYLPLKLKDTDGCFELKEKAKGTGFSYKVAWE